MKNTIKQLKVIIFEAVKKSGFEVDLENIGLDKTKTLEHGHFAANIALILGKKHNKNPRDVAQVILDELSKSNLFTKVEIAGPGFINMWVEQKLYSTICEEVVSDLDNYLDAELDLKSNKKTMVIDTSHPNVAKPMGVHHLLSTIIGDTIKKIYLRMGYEVINDNYLGDWGTQFGKLIYAIRTWGNEEVIAKDPIPELLKLYVKFHDESEKKPELDDFGRAEFKKLEEGDVENRKLWELIVEKSMEEFQKIYKRLDIEFDVINGESFYEDKMPSILEDGRKKEIFIDGEKGAWIVPPKDPKDPPAIIRKADGATLYITRDLARIKYWEKTWQPDLMINVVDVAQEFYFNQLFDTTDRLNLTKARNVHVKFGRMQFKDTKMSTRKGNILLLEKVLDEAKERSLKLIQEKGAELSENEQKELARIMGIGSVKYNILHQNRISNITFDWDQMLSMDGNSAPYLMYTIARAKSILRKAEAELSDVANYELDLTEDAETNVVLDLLMYSDALKRASDEFKPNHIANFLYQLAQSFNTFYNAVPVMKAEGDVKKSRLLLIGAVITVMEDAFRLLGLEVPEKM